MNNQLTLKGIYLVINQGYMAELQAYQDRTGQLIRAAANRDVLTVEELQRSTAHVEESCRKSKYHEQFLLKAAEYLVGGRRASGHTQSPSDNTDNMSMLLFSMTRQMVTI